MPDAPDPKDLENLEARISALKKAQEPAPAQAHHESQVGMAWRLVLELVVGLGIGFGIGYGLDSFLGTRPFMMILFILLGFAAGVRTMMRSAQEIQEKNIADAKAADKKQD